MLHDSVQHLQESISGCALDIHTVTTDGHVENRPDSLHKVNVYLACFVREGSRVLQEKLLAL